MRTQEGERLSKADSPSYAMRSQGNNDVSRDKKPSEELTKLMEEAANFLTDMVNRAQQLKMHARVENIDEEIVRQTFIKKSAMGVEFTNAVWNEDYATMIALLIEENLE